MATRTGVPSLITVANELCRLIVKFSPVIQLAYPGNSAVLAALAAANAACAALSEELVAIREIGD